MHWSHIMVFVLVQCECFVNNTNHDCANVKTHVGAARKRRHLAFPENSNMVLTISLVKAFMTHAPSGWNIALEIDVMFPLPEEKFTSRFFRRKLHHRQKREFWDRLQSAIDFHNMNGRSCILRSICEARTRLVPPGRSLVHDILRVIFSHASSNIDFVDTLIKKYAEAHERRLHHHVNVEAIQLLGNTDIVRRLKRTKPFEVPLHEEDFRKEMTHYNEFEDPDFCDQPNDCLFSLLDFVLSMNKQSY